MAGGGGGGCPRKERRFGHGGRALSHRPSALRPKLLPRCGVPFVTFLDLITLGLGRASTWAVWGLKKGTFATCEPGDAPP